MFSETFNALTSEAEFTKAMLGSGATQIRHANYASKGIYFQAFTSLSTGLERIGKLCLMMDHFIDNQKFPSLNSMKSEIGHDIQLLYKKSQAVITNRAVKMVFLKNLESPIHQSILKILSNFAKSDRYANINLLVGSQRSDPIALWYTEVDQSIYENSVSSKKKQKISTSAKLLDRLVAPYLMVMHTSEEGREISNVEDASCRTGIYEAISPLRQLLVLQIIRYWTELLISLQYTAMNSGSEDIPYFNEIFRPFYNPDSYIKSRKTWDTI